MSVTVSGTQITFNDGTTQSTAATNTPASLAIGSITIGYNFNTVSYTVGSTVSSANVGYGSSAPTFSNLGASVPMGYAVRGGNVTVPGTTYSTVAPATTALPGTWRALSTAPTRAYDPCPNVTYGPAFLIMRIA